MSASPTLTYMPLAALLDEPEAPSAPPSRPTSMHGGATSGSPLAPSAAPSTQFVQKQRSTSYDDPAAMEQRVPVYRTFLEYESKSTGAVAFFNSTIALKPHAIFLDTLPGLMYLKCSFDASTGVTEMEMAFNNTLGGSNASSLVVDGAHLVGGQAWACETNTSSSPPDGNAVSFGFSQRVLHISRRAESPPSPARSPPSVGDDNNTRSGPRANDSSAPALITTLAMSTTSVPPNEALVYMSITYFTGEAVALQLAQQLGRLPTTAELNDATARSAPPPPPPSSSRRKLAASETVYAPATSVTLLSRSISGGGPLDGSGLSISGSAGNSFLTFNCRGLLCLSELSYSVYLSVTLSASVTVNINAAAGSDSGDYTVLSPVGVPGLSIGFSILNSGFNAGFQFGVDAPWSYNLSKALSYRYTWTNSVTITAGTGNSRAVLTSSGASVTTAGSVPEGLIGYGRIGVTPNLRLGVTGKIFGYSVANFGVGVSSLTYGMDMTSDYSATGLRSLRSTYSGCSKPHSSELSIAPFLGGITANRDSSVYGACAGEVYGADASYLKSFERNAINEGESSFAAPGSWQLYVIIFGCLLLTTVVCAYCFGVWRWCLRCLDDNCCEKKKQRSVASDNKNDHNHPTMPPGAAAAPPVVYVVPNNDNGGTVDIVVPHQPLRSSYQSEGASEVAAADTVLPADTALADATLYIPRRSLSGARSWARPSGEEPPPARYSPLQRNIPPSIAASSRTLAAYEQETWTTKEQRIEEDTDGEKAAARTCCGGMGSAGAAGDCFGRGAPPLY